MCHERERLIDYLYGEADPEERARVGRHLDECEDCRIEVGDLRRVREDLLAWDVPQSDSVWTPFARAKGASWWREVPAWAMAAAATLTFAVGAAGGLVTHAMVSPAVDVLPTVAAVTQQPPQTSDAELAALTDLRAQIALLRADLAAQAARTEAVSAEVGSVGALSDHYGEVLELLNSMNTSVGSNASEIGRLKREWATYVAMQGNPGRN